MTLAYTPTVPLGVLEGVWGICQLPTDQKTGWFRQRAQEARRRGKKKKTENRRTAKAEAPRKASGQLPFASPAARAIETSPRNRSSLAFLSFLCISYIWWFDKDRRDRRWCVGKLDVPVVVPPFVAVPGEVKSASNQRCLKRTYLQKSLSMLSTGQSSYYGVTD